MTLTLHLSLKEKWFRMIQSGEKREEYREITPYWMKRLCYLLVNRGDGWIDRYTMTEGEARNVIEHLDEDLRNGNIEIRSFTDVHFTLGYPKADDAARHMTRQIADITIGTGRPEWGAVEGKQYFVIKLEP